MATTYTQYTGTYDTEYEKALAQAQKERTAADTYLSGNRAADEAGLARQRDYSTDVLGKSLAAAQKDAYGTYMNQQRLLPNQLRALGVTGGGSETANARLNTAYQNTRGTAQASYDKSLADALNQWNLSMNDIASRYGQMGYQNLQNMYNSANTNGWNRYNAGTALDSDMWNRANTEEQQRVAQINLEEQRRIAQANVEEERRLAQANADREYQLALDQWNFSKEQAAAAAAMAAARAGSGGGGGGGGYERQAAPAIPGKGKNMGTGTVMGNGAKKPIVNMGTGTIMGNGAKRNDYKYNPISGKFY